MAQYGEIARNQSIGRSALVVVDYLAQHREILHRAATAGLPKRIGRGDDESVPMHTLRELIDEGYIRAVNFGGLESAAYLDARITVAGREYLNALERRASERSWRRRMLKAGLFFAGALTTALIQLVVGLLR